MIDEDVDLVALYKVVMALSRLVLKIEQQTNDDDNEWFDINAMNDTAILKEALKGE